MGAVEFDGFDLCRQVAFEPPSVTGDSRPLASRPRRLLVIRRGVLFRPRTTLGLAAKQALLQVPEFALGLLQLAAQSRLTRRCFGIMEQPPHSSAGLGDAAAPVLSGELIL